MITGIMSIVQGSLKLPYPHTIRQPNSTTSGIKTELIISALLFDSYLKHLFELLKIPLLHFCVALPSFCIDNRTAVLQLKLPVSSGRQVCV